MFKKIMLATMLFAGVSLGAMDSAVAVGSRMTGLSLRALLTAEMFNATSKYCKGDEGFKKTMGKIAIGCVAPSVYDQAVNNRYFSEYYSLKKRCKRFLEVGLYFPSSAAVFAAGASALCKEIYNCFKKKSVGEKSKGVIKRSLAVCAASLGAFSYISLN